MATWNSTPNVPNTGGTFNFPQNTTDDDIVYTINYTDDSGCTASTTYTVPSCSCGRYKFFDLGTNIAASGGTQALCYSTVKESALVFDAAKSADWITYTRIQSGREYQSYICTVSPNEDSLDRIGDAVFTSRDGCEFTASVTQSGQVQQTYEIGYTLLSTSSILNATINYIQGSASIFTESELSTEIQIIPYYRSTESGCEFLAAETITLADLLELKVNDSLYRDVAGTNLCKASSIRINIPTDPTNIKGRLVLTKR